MTDSERAVLIDRMKQKVQTKFSGDDAYVRLVKVIEEFSVPLIVDTIREYEKIKSTESSPND